MFYEPISNNLRQIRIYTSHFKFSGNRTQRYSF